MICEICGVHTENLICIKNFKKKITQHVCSKCVDYIRARNLEFMEE